MRGRKLKINKIINKPFPRPAWQWHGAVRAGATSCTGSRGRPLAVAGGEAATEDAALAMASAVAAGAAGAVTVATAARGRWQWRQPVDGRPAGLRPDCFDSFGFQKISDGFRFRGWPVRHSRAPSREHKSADFCQDRPPPGAVTAPRILLLRGAYPVKGRAKRLTGGRRGPCPVLGMVVENDVPVTP